MFFKLMRNLFNLQFVESVQQVRQLFTALAVTPGNSQCIRLKLLTVLTHVSIFPATKLKKIMPIGLLQNLFI